MIIAATAIGIAVIGLVIAIKSSPAPRFPIRSSEHFPTRVPGSVTSIL